MYNNFSGETSRRCLSIYIQTATLVDGGFKGGCYDEQKFLLAIVDPYIANFLI